MSAAVNKYAWAYKIAIRGLPVTPDAARLTQTEQSFLLVIANLVRDDVAVITAGNMAKLTGLSDRHATRLLTAGAAWRFVDVKWSPGGARGHEIRLLDAAKAVIDRGLDMKAMSNLAGKLPREKKAPLPPQHGHQRGVQHGHAKNVQVERENQDANMDTHGCPGNMDIPRAGAEVVPSSVDRGGGEVPPPPRTIGIYAGNDSEPVLYDLARTGLTPAREVGDDHELAEILNRFADATDRIRDASAPDPDDAALATSTRCRDAASSAAPYPADARVQRLRAGLMTDHAGRRIDLPEPSSIGVEIRTDLLRAALVGRIVTSVLRSDRDPDAAMRIELREIMKEIALLDLPAANAKHLTDLLAPELREELGRRLAADEGEAR